MFDWVSNTPLLSVKNKERNYFMSLRRQMLIVNVQFLETLNKLCIIKYQWNKYNQRENYFLCIVSI